MNDKSVSDLRRCMLEDMPVRHLGEKTRHDYITHIETFTRFLGRSPVLGLLLHQKRTPWALTVVSHGCA